MPKTGIYRYRLTSTGGNSQKYGACEICGKPCSEVFMQSSDRLYDKSFAPEAPQDPKAPKGYGWAVLPGAFGHRECLEAKQQELRLPLTLEQFREEFCPSCDSQHPLHPANWKQHEPDAPACQ